MARGRRSPAQRLRAAVAAMPQRTREAMLRGIERNRIIVGAYTDKRGGVCPMLAAHRNGGRTDFGTFARAWDQFTEAEARKPRRASRREVNALRAYLEMSLARQALPDRPLGQEVREVKAARRRLAEAAARDAAAEPLGDALAESLAAFEGERAERRAAELLDGDPGSGRRLRRARSRERS